MSNMLSRITRPYLYLHVVSVLNDQLRVKGVDPKPATFTMTFVNSANNPWPVCSVANNTTMKVANGNYGIGHTVVSQLFIGYPALMAKIVSKGRN